MSIRTRASFLSAVAGAWTPENIPWSLKFSEFDFERSALMTVSGGKVDQMIDPVTGVAWTNTLDNRPAYAATGFGGRPCIVGTGASGECLKNTTASATLGWPTGATPFEVWSVFAYDVRDGAAAADLYLQHPSTTVSQSFQLGTVGQPRQVRFFCGDGAVNNQTFSLLMTSANYPGRDQYSRYIARAVATGTSLRLELNGLVSPTQGTVACIPALSAAGAFHTIGGTAQATPISTFRGKLNFFGLYRPLPDAYAARLYSYLNTRIT